MNAEARLMFLKAAHEVITIVRWMLDERRAGRGKDQIEPSAQLEAIVEELERVRKSVADNVAPPPLASRGLVAGRCATDWYPYTPLGDRIMEVTRWYDQL